MYRQALEMHNQASQLRAQALAQNARTKAGRLERAELNMQAAVFESKAAELTRKGFLNVRDFGK